jgi:transcriptional regulator with XRE-family HTH domain
MIRKKGIASEIKTRIINAMNQKGLNQSLLASRIDTSQQAVNKLLNHSQDISISKMEKIAEALDIKFNELLPLNIIQNNNESSKENIQIQSLTINEKEVLNQLLENQKLLLEMIKEIVEANKNKP